jgi:hypothetical protein
MDKKILSLLLTVFLCSSASLFSQDQLRSFDEIFPSLDTGIREQVFSPSGYFAAYGKNYQTLDSTNTESLFLPKIVRLKPSVVVEALFIVPYPSQPIEMVDIYNGLRKIRSLKGRLYHSQTRDADVPLFEDATRLKSSKRTATTINDPPPQTHLPDGETIFIRLKDVNFGNTYYQVDIKKNSTGFIYSLFNNRDMAYIIIPVIKSGHFIVQFYFEPIAEGILIYSLSGAEVSDFIASQVDMPSAIQKRLAVILEWIIDGVSGNL